MNQKAEANEGATVVQVAGNLSYGLNYADCERLFSLLLAENFPKLEAVAAQKAKENVDALVKATYEKIESRIDKISAEKLAQPDVQSTFNEAVQGAAKKGEKVDIDLLAELLEARIETENTDYLEYCIEAAVEIVPKLTSEMVALLPALHFIQALTYNVPEDLDNAYGYIFARFLSKCSEITPSKMKTIASLGAGNYINIVGSNTFNDMTKKYTFLLEDGAAAKFPKMISALRFYDNKGFHQLTLTTPGQVIAVKLLTKIFPSMTLKNCIQ